MDWSHLDVLKEKLQTGTDFSEIFSYFVDNFGENEEFAEMGEPGRNPIAERGVIEAMAKVVKGDVAIGALMIVRIPDKGLLHGTFMVQRSMASFFYLESIQMGCAAITSPELKGQMLFTRFTGMPLPKNKNPRAN